MKYKIHRFDLNMTKDKDKLELFLNGLHGEVAAIIPHVTITFMWIHKIDYILVVEKTE